MKHHTIAQELLGHAGITINGQHPWDLQTKHNEVISRIIKGGAIALGESFMDGEWDADELDEFFSKVLRAKLDSHVKKSPTLIWNLFLARFTNMQTKSRARIVGEKHYDIGNDLYERMLDKRMVYTCGYWKDAHSLDEAQETKLDLVCKKIGLKQGDKVLDIGCGWGSFAKFAAEKYGAIITGITVSKEQAELARQRCQGLPVTILLEDYRNIDQRFDHVISLGMFEHVGYKNYRTYMEVVAKNLKDDGLFLLHTIGGNQSVTTTDPWINKYIFPNSMLPSPSQITDAIEGLFIMEDWHNFGPDYDKTLMAWWNNFNTHWHEISEKYGERFYRMWKYYLLSCAGSFRSRRNQLWQIVLSKNGVPGGYESIR